jgi:hypothetical protein
MRFLSRMMVWCLMGVFTTFSWASDSVPEQAAKLQSFQQSSYAHLQKQIGLTLFQNKSSLQDDRLVTIADDALVGAMAKMCAGIVPVQDGNPVFLEIRNHQPRHISGKIDNMTLAQKGREAGLTAVVSGTITEIREFQEELGYLWFKEMMYFVEVHMHYSMYDTETGAKLLDKFVSEKRDLPEDIYRQLQSKDYESSFSEIQGIIISLSSILSEEICEKMEKELFKTFVKSTDGKKVVLTSGSNAGLKSGDLFQIHDSGQMITGKEEHQFFIVGPKTGILRIDTVKDDSASASIVQGDIKGKNACLKPIVEESFFSKLF